jgi:glycerol uptake facilitator-like aquaporin
VWIAAIAEFVGTAILVTVIVGSGIMATNLTRDVGVALLLNDVATVLVLGLLIWILGSTSGAHFNPVVSLIMTLRTAISAGTMLVFVVAQILGGVVGAIVANTMYARAAISVSHTVRGGSGQLLAEVIATAGLVAIICIGVDRGQSAHLKFAVPAWIASAYVFTSSTSFANPAVTIGRIFSDSFAGISPHSISGFIAAQCVGAFIGFAGARALARTTDAQEQHV